jgi:hypothetical protein
MCATHHEIAHHASYVYLSRCPSLLPSPMGRLLTRLPRLLLQGGGVYVQSGTVTITSSSIYGNTAAAGNVRAHVPVALLGYSHVLRFVLAERWKRWWCLCQLAAGRHNNHFVFLHLREHRQILCARSCSRRPAGVFTCFAFCACRAVVSMSTRSREAQSQSSTAECIPTKLLAPMYVPATPAKSRPSALFHMFRACACRVAVSMSSTAQSRLGLP